MVKKTLGYVQLEWTCPNCQTKNPGLKKVCSGCGAAQPEQVAFEQAAQEEFITDQAVIDQAKAGPDIHCAYCGARNPAGAETCSRCGGDLTQAQARAAGQVLGAHRDKAAEPVACPKCGTANPALARNCSQCGASLVGAEPASARVPAAPAPAAPKGRAKMSAATIILGGLFVVICLVVAIVVILSLRTEETTSQVQSVEWTRTIAIEALRPVTYETWYDEIPNDALVGSCTSKAHHRQAEPADNAVEICGTPYTVDTGSGVGQVRQDCEYEVYADWCEYTVDEWQEVDSRELAGDDLFPEWPVISLAADQREGKRTELYQVTFSSDGEQYTYTTSSASDFGQFEVGSQWVLEVNTFGAVRSATPAD